MKQHVIIAYLIQKYSTVKNPITEESLHAISV